MLSISAGSINCSDLSVLACCATQYCWLHIHMEGHNAIQSRPDNRLTLLFAISLLWQIIIRGKITSLPFFFIKGKRLVSVSYMRHATFKNQLGFIFEDASICRLCELFFPQGYQCLWVDRGLCVSTAASPAATYKPATAAGREKKRERESWQSWMDCIKITHLDYYWIIQTASLY